MRKSRSSLLQRCSISSKVSLWYSCRSKQQRTPNHIHILEPQNHRTLVIAAGISSDSYDWLLPAQKGSNSCVTHRNPSPGKATGPVAGVLTCSNRLLLKCLRKVKLFACLLRSAINPMAGPQDAFENLCSVISKVEISKLWLKNLLFTVSRKGLKKIQAYPSRLYCCCLHLL